MRFLAALSVGLLLGLGSTSAQADSINLLQVQNKAISVHETPDTKSKVLETIAAKQMIIPFFEQKDWVKIAYPKNGQVGWVVKADLSQNTLTVVSVNNPRDDQYIVTQKSSDDNHKIYSAVEYSNNTKFNQQQTEDLIKQIQLQQQQMQERFNKMFAQPIIIIQQPVNNVDKSLKK